MWLCGYVAVWLSSKGSKFQEGPLLKNIKMTKLPFHGFWQMWNSYPIFWRFLVGSSAFRVQLFEISVYFKFPILNFQVSNFQVSNFQHYSFQFSNFQIPFSFFNSNISKSLVHILSTIFKNLDSQIYKNNSFENGFHISCVLWSILV